MTDSAAGRPPTFRRCTDNSYLHLILLPTEACNFRCTYCYEDFKLKSMSVGIVEGLERWIESRAPTLRVLRLTWFGGEPLLAARTVERLQRHVNRLAAVHGNMQARSDMTTNAYLLSPALFARLVDLGVTEFQVTFDGPREFHDRKRVLADGRGTFDRIWSNLLATRALSSDFSIVVRLHVDRDNRDALGGFVDRYNEQFAADPRYRLFVRKLARFGGPNDAALPILEDAEAEEAARSLTESCGDARDPVGAELGPAVCYGARANAFVVRADGGLHKCTVALGHPANRVGRLCRDGTVELDRRRLAPWLRGLWTADAAALTCPLHELTGSIAVARA